MKKLSTLLIALSITFMLSCHHHPHVVIATHSNNYDMRLEYTGTFAFSNDRTKIQAISRNGYIDFKRNGDELYASTDPVGHVRYKLNGTQVNKLDDMGQGMLDEAIRMIIKSSR